MLTPVFIPIAPPHYTLEEYQTILANSTIPEKYWEDELRCQAGVHWMQVLRWITDNTSDNDPARALLLFHEHKAHRAFFGMYSVS